MKKVKFILRRLYLNSGGYDSSGSYFGIGAPLYQYWDEDTGDISGTLRAYSRDTAKREIAADMFRNGITPVFFN